jgi:hypothetical protein
LIEVIIYAFDNLTMIVITIFHGLGIVFKSSERSLLAVHFIIYFSIYQGSVPIQHREEFVYLLISSGNSGLENQLNLNFKFSDFFLCSDYINSNV